MSDALLDLWLPLGIAFVGVGGTIGVTIVQLRARRKELDDERAEQALRDQEAKRDAIVFGVHDAIEAMIAAVYIPPAERTIQNLRGTRVMSKVGALINVYASEDANDLMQWWANRTTQWAKATEAEAPALEFGTKTEIHAWHQRTANAAMLAAVSVILPQLPDDL